MAHSEICTVLIGENMKSNIELVFRLQTHM